MGQIWRQKRERLSSILSVEKKGYSREEIKKNVVFEVTLNGKSTAFFPWISSLLWKVGKS